MNILSYKMFESKAEQQALMDLAVKKYGSKAIKLALNALYKWTRGDMFKVNEEILEPLSVFKPKPLPKFLYKGIRENLIPKRYDGKGEDYFWEWKDDNNRGDSGKKNREEFINKNFVDNLTSWTTNPNIAAKFASGNIIFVFKNPQRDDIFTDITMIPSDYRFSGEIRQSGGLLLGGDRIEVPSNEKEVIVKVTKSSIKKIYPHQVDFTTGKYLGDYKVDTMGLTKRAVSWHVSPV